MDRREFLKYSLPIGLSPWVSPLLALTPAGRDMPIELAARADTIQVVDDGGSRTRIWGYNGQVPGPTIRLKQKDWVRARLVNRLPVATTIHWHGIRIDNAMDGVSGLTQDAVDPGRSFDYAFQVPDAGTFWYHAHTRSWEQVARGLYGVLVVDETEPVPVDRDYVFVIDDWQLDQDAQIHEASFGSLHDWSHGGRLGQWITVNGKPFEKFPVTRGQRIRLRVVNTANARVFTLNFGKLEPYVIAFDGQPAAPRPLGKFLTIAPAQRVDLVFDMIDDAGGSTPVEVMTRREVIQVAEFVSERAAGPRSNSVFQPFAELPANPLPTALQLADAKRVGLLMEGGAMGGMRSAMLKGKQLSIQELVSEGAVWAFNGTVGMSDAPLVSARRGQTVVIDIRNQNRWPHAMHLHGHHFKVIERDGRVVNDEIWRDTELIQAGESASIGFVADNPGKWLFHCHMLEHQAGGMTTWLEII